jgi:hypothetical protein
VIIGGWILISIGIGLLLTRGGDNNSSAVPASAAVQTAAVTPTSAPATADTEAPTASPTPESTPVTFSNAEVEVFLDGLRAAGTAADVDRLMASTRRYSTATASRCGSYLETIDLALTVQVREVFDPAPWEWTTDDGAVQVFDEALEIEVSRNVNSQTFIQLMHLVPSEDLAHLAHRLRRACALGAPTGRGASQEFRPSRGASGRP